MKVWLFRAIAVFIPVLFFILLEVGLRTAGYGQSYPLFISNPSAEDYLLPRPDVVKRYFPNSADIPSVSIEANFFRKQKPQNGKRFFVQGGSTAAGFPYGLGASIAGMLDHRLKQSYPDHYVEVVNTSLAAVNSYTNLDMVDEIIAQKPDAVLIYMGHNEFLGIMGVGSNYTAANSSATTLLFLKLKDFRTFQLLQNLYHSLKARPKNSADLAQASLPSSEFSASRTFMAKVAKHKNIGMDSELFHAGIDQFENNLALILEKYQKAGVPVFISTLVSNVLDQSPFASDDIPNSLQNALQQLIEQRNNGALNQNSLESFAQNIHSLASADAHFQLGRLYLSIGDADTAKQHLLKAKELDLLRFRAPEAINSIIRNHALVYGAHLVDAQKRFEQRSKSKLVGNNLMLEHLHPNVQGYFLLSDSFYQQMQASNTLQFSRIIESNSAYKDRLLLPAEEYYGFSKVLQLKTDYPFVDTPKPLKLPRPQNWEQSLGKALFDKKIDWLQMVRTSHTRYHQEKNVAQAIKSQIMLADALPHVARINLETAELLLKNNQKARAQTYIQRAIWSGADKKIIKTLQDWQ